jgi:hypothetical protein
MSLKNSIVDNPRGQSQCENDDKKIHERRLLIRMNHLTLNGD